MLRYNGPGRLDSTCAALAVVSPPTTAAVPSGECYSPLGYYPFVANQSSTGKPQAAGPSPARRLDPINSPPSLAYTDSGALESSTVCADQNIPCQTHRTLTHNALAGCRERLRTFLHPTNQNPPSDIPTLLKHLREHWAAKACPHRASQMVLHPIGKRTPDRIRQTKMLPGVRAIPRAIG